MDKILTISIAAYNVEKYIVQTLDALCSCKKLDKIDALIIDDGATDGTKKIAERYVKKYPDSFKFVHKSNGGWGSTVNTGISLAEGKYFKQLDGDDYFNPDSMDYFINYLENTDDDLVISKVLTFDDITGDALDVTDFPEGCKFETTMPIQETNNYIRLIMHTCTFKTEILKNNEVKICEHCFYTDQEYFIKSLAYCSNASVIDKVIYCYRLGREGQSMSISGQLKHYKDNFIVIDSLIDFENNLSNDIARNIVHSYIYKYLIGIYNRLIFLGKRTDLVNFDRHVRTDFLNYKNELPKRINMYSKFKFHLAGPLDRIIYMIKK